MVKIDTGVTPFDPDAYKNLPPFDWLGRMLNRKHEVVAEHAPGRIWEIRCRYCRYTYILDHAQITAKRIQPCHCDMHR